MVALEGRLQVRSYEARDGSRRKVWEVIVDSIQFLSPKARDDGEGQFEE